MYRGEQPVFTPPFKGQTFRFEGTAVDVEALLAEVPEGKEKTRPEVAEQAQADPVFRALEARGGVLRELSPGKYAVVCPFEAEHSEETMAAIATVRFRACMLIARTARRRSSAHAWGSEVAPMIRPHPPMA